MHFRSLSLVLLGVLQLTAEAKPIKRLAEAKSNVDGLMGGAHNALSHTQTLASPQANDGLGPGQANGNAEQAQALQKELREVEFNAWRVDQEGRQKLEDHREEHALTASEQDLQATGPIVDEIQRQLESLIDRKRQLLRTKGDSSLQAQNRYDEEAREERDDILDYTTKARADVWDRAEQLRQSRNKLEKKKKDRKHQKEAEYNQRKTAFEAGDYQALNKDWKAGVQSFPKQQPPLQHAPQQSPKVPQPRPHPLHHSQQQQPPKPHWPRSVHEHVNKILTPAEVAEEAAHGANARILTAAEADEEATKAAAKAGLREALDD